MNFYFPHQTVDARSNSAGGSFACMRRCADRAMPQHIKQFKRMQIPIKKPVSWSDYPAQTEKLKARKEEDEWNCAVEVEVSVAVCVWWNGEGIPLFYFIWIPCARQHFTVCRTTSPPPAYLQLMFVKRPREYNRGIVPRLNLIMKSKQHRDEAMCSGSCNEKSFLQWDSEQSSKKANRENKIN